MSHLDEGRLHALLDGELEGAERREVEAHLGSCAECRAALAEAKALFEEADALVAKVDLPPSTTTQARPVAGGATRRSIPWQRVALAATVTLAVGLGLLAKWEMPRSRGAAESALASMPDSLAGSRPTAAPAADAVRESAPRAGAEEYDAQKQGQAQVPKSVEPSRALRNEVAPPVNQPSSPSELVAKPAPSAPPAPVSQATGAVGAATDKVSEPVTALQGGASPSRADAGSAERRDAAPAEAEAPALAARPAQGFVPADARLKREAASRYRTVALEEAVRILGGSVRLVDGLTPVRVLAGKDTPGTVRVVYDDPPGRELWLDQERPVPGTDRPTAPGQRATALLPGDTLVSPAAEGARSLRWIDQSGFRLGLTGFLPADSLRALSRRVQ